MRVDADGHRWLGYDEVQDVLGISRERVRQLKSKLRHQLLIASDAPGGREMLFLLDDVLAFKTNRRPGRPKNSEKEKAELVPPTETGEEQAKRMEVEIKLLRERVGALSAAFDELSTRLAVIEARTEGALVVRIPRWKDPLS